MSSYYLYCCGKLAMYCVNGISRRHGGTQSTMLWNIKMFVQCGCHTIKQVWLQKMSFHRYPIESMILPAVTWFVLSVRSEHISHRDLWEEPFVCSSILDIAILPVVDFSVTIICRWSVVCSPAEQMWPWVGVSKIPESVKSEVWWVWYWRRGFLTRITHTSLWDTWTPLFCVIWCRCRALLSFIYPIILPQFYWGIML